MFNNNKYWLVRLLNDDLVTVFFSHWILFSYFLLPSVLNPLLPFLPWFPRDVCRLLTGAWFFSFQLSLHEFVTRVRVLLLPHVLRPPHHCVWFLGTRHFVCVLWCIVDPVICWSQTQLAPNLWILTEPKLGYPTFINSK
jgi:hypothetical protein